jgi:hypothetical protein
MQQPQNHSKRISDFEMHQRSRNMSFGVPLLATTGLCPNHKTKQESPKSSSKQESPKSSSKQESPKSSSKQESPKSSSAQTGPEVLDAFANGLNESLPLHVSSNHWVMSGHSCRTLENNVTQSVPAGQSGVGHLLGLVRASSVMFTILVPLSTRATRLTFIGFP